MRIIYKSLLVFFMLFLVPTIAAAAWWASTAHPQNWRNADWGTSNLLAGNPDKGQAAIYIMAARTGGFKGAFAVHSWILIKRDNQIGYDRYDKVGWGNPVRKNHRVADAKWYSNTPFIVERITGNRAEALIPKVEHAIANYPYAKRGDYTLWPGPNSNTFVSTVLRQVPELNAELPPNAVGRDYLGKNTWYLRESDGSDTHISLGGLVGLSYGDTIGFELHFMGQSLGIDINRPAIKLPAFGRLEIS